MGCVAKGIARHPGHHVDDLVRRRHRAHLHVHAGAQAVEAVRAAGGQAPQGRPAQGRDRDLVVQELPLQPPREGRARRAAGIPVPAGKRRQPEPRRPGRHRPPRHSARLGADRQRPEEGRRRRSRPSARRRRSSDCSARSSASSRRSRASRPPARAVSARSRPVSRKRSSRPRSAWSSPSRRCGSTTT